LPDGQPAVSFSNWGWCDDEGYRWGDTLSPTYYLDPDHPGAQAFMAEIVRDAVRAGWRYLKLDFTYGLSTARQAVNRSRTSMETLREMYRLFREAAGQIHGCFTMRQGIPSAQDDLAGCIADLKLLLA
jgi:acetyl esterase